MQSQLQNWHQRLLRVLHTQSNTGGLIMKKNITLDEFCPDIDISNDMEELYKYIDANKFNPTRFYVSRLNESYYWYLTFKWFDCDIAVCSQMFGNLHYLLEDIAKLSHHLFAKYCIELPYPDNQIEKPL
jgi:hypothetical protein